MSENHVGSQAGNPIGARMYPLPLPEKLTLFGKRIRLRHICAGVMAFGLMGSVWAGSSSLQNWSAERVAKNQYADYAESMQTVYKVSPDGAETAEKQNVGFLPIVKPVAKPPATRKTVAARSGDTIIGLLTNAGVNRGEAHQAVEAMKKVFNPRDMRAGQEFRLHFAHFDGESILTGVETSPSVISRVTVFRTDEGEYKADRKEQAVSANRRAISASIESSLFKAGLDAGASNNVLAQLIQVYSYEVDFQRDIRAGDKFEIFYEQRNTESGTIIGDAKILYASLNLGGRDITVYRFERNGRPDYFDEKGQSIRKALLSTPVDGARISSGFGMRRHPIQGYNRMHKGIDFAAPTGTPIYAAGDGVIERASRFSGYGNYVRIRHNNGIQTAYAHLSRYGKGISAGSRVRQGQVIGYVGCTGSCTGPHLHYEVLVGGNHVNPRSLNLPTGEKLAGDDLRRFQKTVSQIKQEFKRDHGQFLVARNQQTVQ